MESWLVKLKSTMGKTHTQFKILTSERVLTITTVEHNVLSGYKKTMHSTPQSTVQKARIAATISVQQLSTQNITVQHIVICHFTFESSCDQGDVN